MSTLEPGLFLRSMSEELGRKSGGGASKDPLVDITPEFRSSLRAGLEIGFQALRDVSEPQRKLGIPLRIQLRERAFAKSNRPTKLLADADAAPQASERVGELIARVTAAQLSQLASAVDSTKGADQYAISAFEAFSVWRPIEDGFRTNSVEDVNNCLEISHTSDTPLRIDFFPWLSLDSEVGEELSIRELLRRLGFRLLAVSKSVSRPSAYFQVTEDARGGGLTNLYGIRRASLAPSYGAYPDVVPQSFVLGGPVAQSIIDDVSSGPTRAAAVGILDSGVDSTLLAPWTLATEIYDPPSYQDPLHGTFVAGLVAACASLNPLDTCFPSDAASFIDAQVLPAGPIDEATLMTRIDDALAKHAGTVKVWNCSFGNADQLDPLEYGVLANQMDRWSEQYGVLFVQAAGNYADTPSRTWPPDPSVTINDGISSPAEAVHSLAVGSLSHRGGAAPFGAPSSYSRRGPSFGGQQKPDLCHWSGDLDLAGSINGTGISSISPSNETSESVGTSFATPIVSSIAANVWEELSAAPDMPEVTPALVKGLLVHSASLDNAVPAIHQHFYGAGVPSGNLASLFDAENCFTTVHQVDLSSTWMRTPFPMPDCLFTDAGKLRAEITMTLSYSPKIDEAFGEECVRTSVEASFGVVSQGTKGPTISGKVPEDRPSGGYAWEAQRIAEGKWAPIKTHRARFSQGVAGDDWGLRLSLTTRESTQQPVQQTAYVILTLKAIDPDLPVHQDGIAAVNRLGLWHTQLSPQATINVSI